MVKTISISVITLLALNSVAFSEKNDRQYPSYVDSSVIQWGKTSTQAEIAPKSFREKVLEHDSSRQMPPVESAAYGNIFMNIPYSSSRYEFGF